MRPSKKEPPAHLKVYIIIIQNLLGSAFIAILVLVLTRLVSFVSELLYRGNPPWVVQIIEQISAIEAIIVFALLSIVSTYTTLKQAQTVSKSGS